MRLEFKLLIITGYEHFSKLRVSDMADGDLARKLHAESKTGAVLDSMADLCFVAGVATFAAVQEGHFIRKRLLSN